MTLAAGIPIAKYDGNDSTTEFAVPGYFVNNSQIEVTLVDTDGNESTLVLDTHYTLTGAGTLSGVVTYPKVVVPANDPLATGEQLIVRRVVSLAQTNDATGRGDSFYNALEASLDYLMMCLQQMQEQLNRAPLVSLSYSGSIPDIDTIMSYVSIQVAESKGSLIFHICGNGAPIANGIIFLVAEMPFAGTFTSCRLFADQSGDITVNLLKFTYAQYDAGATHPVAGDTIIDTGASGIEPYFTSGYKYEDTTLVGWDKNFDAGDCFVIALTNADAIECLTASFRFNKTGA